MAKWVRYPPLFGAFPFWRACEVEVRYPPLPAKGYLSDTCAIPYENTAKCVRHPPLRYYLERVLRNMGGGNISHWAAKYAKRPDSCLQNVFCLRSGLSKWSFWKTCRKHRF